MAIVHNDVIKSTAVLPYVKGQSDSLLLSTTAGHTSLFRSNTTLKSHLVQPKNNVNPRKQDGVVCKIPCKCGKVYIGETGRSMFGQIEEHRQSGHMWFA